MKCPNHPSNDVTGYCSVCGTFGCAECLSTHDGSLLCRKHYRPIAQKLEEEKKLEGARRKPSRQRLVVRYQDGRTVYGVCLALNPKAHDFYLEPVDKDGVSSGKTIEVRFSELKAVFNVKSFDGNFDKSLRFRDWTPEGGELVVEFHDGEVVRGYSLHRYDEEEPRFFLIPQDTRSNNISILVEGSAVEGVYSPEEYAAKAREEKAKTKLEGTSDLSQEETMGDFYFETRNYSAALEQYRLAGKRHPQSGRLRKKILFAQYNIGIQFIKRREYPQALECMEGILKVDPRNGHAIKKAAQLRRIMEKGARVAPESPKEETV
ncbi:MAG: hypothetical protein HY706_19215 [Candidatus Hydrogenedentes bacterium]|nr:hypothetical protein [Candidatus Hydrogenedentota bacterium]